MDMTDAMKAAGIQLPSSGNPPEGYFDGTGCLRLEFVSKASLEEKARQLVNDGLTPGQLRRFFNHCRRIERRLKSKATTWQCEMPNVIKLSSFAADALAKGNIQASFRHFIDINVARCRCEKDFVEGFVQHFEALVGFVALHTSERGGGDGRTAKEVDSHRARHTGVRDGSTHRRFTR
jgi:hypothetical protein